MSSAAEHLQDDGSGLGAPVETAHHGRLPKAAVVLVLGLALYLALSLAIPQVVPRLAALPKPADRVTYEDCYGHRGASTSEVWERRGAVWVLTKFTRGGGCIAG